MTVRYSPDHMYRLLVLIRLQQQNGRAFGKIRIVFDECSKRDTFHYFTDRQIVIGQFVVSVLRYSNIARYNKPFDFFKGVAQRLLAQSRRSTPELSRAASGFGLNESLGRARTRNDAVGQLDAVFHNQRRTLRLYAK